MKDYYLGLDIGTDSVGYAVTDEKYNLLKVKGRPAWGSMVFDPVSDNSARRDFRSARRRLDRRQQRVQFVQELFAEEIVKVDPDFYKRLKSSALFREDAGAPYPVFNDANYTDKDYYAMYPTIHHLIVDLMYNTDPHDVRLVYLACAWLVAHRGHFLSNIDQNKLGEIKDFNVVYRDFLSYFTNNGYENPWDCESIQELSEAIRERNGVNAKIKRITSVLYHNNKAPKYGTDEFPFSREAMIRLLAGGTCKLRDLFDKEEYLTLGSVNLEFDDDKMGTIMADIGDDYDLIAALRSIRDWAVLTDSLGDYATISEAKVKTYNDHAEDLKNLKYMIKEYKKDRYNEVFRDLGENNYPAYVGHTDENYKDLKRIGKDDFLKYILGILKDITPKSSDESIYADMISRLELGTFLPKQKNTDNRVIPHQLYAYELKTVLEKASQYLGFLNKTDKEGITVKNKIELVFSFRIPYFVGPLNESSDYSWLVRSKEKIYPWNFEKVVDLDASEQNFIKRMTNSCAFLPGEKVIPKDSLCYHRYMVLNEINNIRINGQRIDVDLKQRIYNELFMNIKKVTRKKLIDFLVCNGYVKKGEEDAVTGIDININSNLASQIAFRRLIASKILTEKDVELIIERATYAEDKSRLLLFLDREYQQLTAEDKKYIASIRIKDFGRLSKRFLTEIEGVCRETGETMTIMSALWNTSDNLMELLSDRYTFKEEIESIKSDYYLINKPTLSDRLDEMYASDSVKRSIYRTLDIIGDVVKAFGEPKKVFVETTRSSSDSQKGKRTKSRRQQIEELYAQCDAVDVRELKKQLEEMGEYADNKLQSDKLFLYYTQFGKCMYSGTPLSLEKLGTKEYDIDHIYPQAYVKDDSVINNKVLVLSSENGKKSDTYPINETIRHKQGDYWKNLKDCGAISEEKYKRLTRRTPFTDDEKYGFINRQIVETSQSTKAVAVLLKDRFPDTEIVYSKAGLVSDFRSEFKIYKSRSFNDLHHAVDAFLNIVVGNVYNMRFTKKWFSVDSNYSIKTKTLFTHTIIVNGRTIWDGEDMLGQVKRIAEQDDAHFTKYSFFKTGGLFDQMPVAASEGLVPRKKGLPTEKYGGYNKSSVMFFVPVKYSVGKKTDIMIMSVELAVGKRFLDDNAFSLEYSKARIEKITGKTVGDISYPLGRRPLKINSVLSLDGFRVCITGSAGGGKCLSVQPMVQLCASQSWKNYTKRLEKLIEKINKNDKYVYSEEFDKVTADRNLEFFDILLDKLGNSIYRLRPNNPIKILSDGKSIFQSLDVISQTKCILNVLQILGRMTGGCDLRYIGGAGKSAATVNFSSNVSNWCKNYKCVQIVDMSPSGIWEKKSENLLKLL